MNDHSRYAPFPGRRDPGNSFHSGGNRPPPPNRGPASLQYFRGRMSHYLSLDDARHDILNLYSGHVSEHWAIQEIMDSMGALVQYKAGIAFLADIGERMQYRCPEWVSAIFRHFEPILTCRAGYALFERVIWDAPDNYFASFTRFCFDKFNREDDPEFFRLLCVIVRVISDAPSEYERFACLGLYLQRPLAACIGRSVLECGHQKVVVRFQNEIVANLPALLFDGNLCEIVSGCLVRGPRMYRDRIIQELQTRYHEMLMDPLKLKVVGVVLSVGTLHQKAFCADAVARFMISMREMTRDIDELMVFALNALDVSSRGRLIQDFSLMIRITTCHMPLLAEYLMNIGKVYQCHPE